MKIDGGTEYSNRIASSSSEIVERRKKRGVTAK